MFDSRCSSSGFVPEVVIVLSSKESAFVQFIKLTQQKVAAPAFFVDSREKEKVDNEAGGRLSCTRISISFTKDN